MTVLYPAEFSLSAYKRNKRKMELAEKMDPGQNQRKRRRKSSETVSAVMWLEFKFHFAVQFLFSLIHFFTRKSV